jgi:hypothetical protein
LFYEIFYNGLIVKNENEFKNLFSKNPDYLTGIFKDSIKYPCYYKYESPKLDMNKRDLLLFSIYTGGGQPNHLRYFYKNTILKQYLYHLRVERTSGTQENSSFVEKLSIPKIESDYTIKFDTLFIGL